MEHLLIKQINLIDRVDYPAYIGFVPKKRKAWHYFYYSPFASHSARRETTNRQRGSLDNLAVRLYDYATRELTPILLAALLPVQQLRSAEYLYNNSLITIKQARPIRPAYRQRYFWEYHIPLDVARIYCLDTGYDREDNCYSAMAFRTGAGCFELIPPNRQFWLLHCGPLHIYNDSLTIAFFRPLFDLPPYVGPARKFAGLLLPNSPVAFQTLQESISPHRHKHLLLPNDGGGIAFTTWAARTFQDCQVRRSLYAGYRSLNDCICCIGTTPSPQISLSRINAPPPAFTPQGAGKSQKTTIYPKLR